MQHNLEYNEQSVQYGNNKESDFYIRKEASRVLVIEADTNGQRDVIAILDLNTLKFIISELTQALSEYTE